MLSLLIAARGLLARAGAANDGTGPGAMAGVILYDVAVETAAKAIFWQNVPNEHPGDGYVTKAGELQKPLANRDPSLPRVLDGLLAAYRLRNHDDRAELPHRRDARRLHEFRNTVQHDAVLPSDEDVLRSRLRATDFLDALCKAFIGVGLNEISRARLVWADAVRIPLIDAERHIELGKYSDAMGALAVAFETGRRMLHSSRPFTRHQSTGFNVSEVIREMTQAAPMTGPSSARDPFADMRRFGALQSLLSDLIHRQEHVEDLSDALLLGASAEQYAWFKARAPRVNWRRRDSDVEWVGDPQPLDREPTADEARQALDFVVSAALRWQATSQTTAPANS